MLGGYQQADVTAVYGDSIDFVTGESLDSYLGDVLELTWAREDVDIGLYSGDGNGDMHRITYRGEGGYSEEMVIFKDIETLIFDSEGEREVVLPGYQIALLLLEQFFQFLLRHIL